MSWEPVRAATANSERSAVPPYGLRIGITGRSADGPRSCAGYTAISFGRHLATTMGLVKTEQRIALMIGIDHDYGRIAFQPDDDGPFKAKKQPDGSYSIALGYHSSKGFLARTFARFTIERAVPIADGRLIVEIPPAARAPGEVM